MKLFHARSQQKRTVGQRVMFGIVFVLFLAYAFTILYSFVWCFLSTVRTHSDFVMDKFAWPEQWRFQSYADAFVKLTYNKTNMLGMLFNSLWLTIGGTVLSLSCSMTITYVVAKYKFPGRNILYGIAVVIMVLPIVGSLPASYRLIRSLSLDNSPLILLTYCSGFGFNFLVLYGFFQNLSWSYAEAAFIDGANDFHAFVRVMLPQALPAVFSLVVLSAINLWNDYQNPLLYLPKMPTLSVGIYQFNRNMQYEGNYPVLFAGILLSTLPILALFVTCQNTIMNNTYAGGMKE